MSGQRERNVTFGLFNAVCGFLVVVSILVLGIVELYTDKHFPDIAFLSLYSLAAVSVAISTFFDFRRNKFMFGVGLATLAVIFLSVVLIGCA